MSIRLYNTAHRRKETFVPLQEKQVGIYVCGVTVYDLCHIGHARSAIVFDVLVRYLRARGYQVTYVRNFTDIDDKIIKRARELGKDTTELAEKFIQAFYEDMAQLGVLEADHEPRATEHIDGMIDMIQTLIDKGFAYADGGDVFFAVDKLRSYGTLSGRKLEDMKAGSRIEVDKKKRHPMDFVLWKPAKEGEPSWPSPWGQGRPGWHMECSVMSNRFLGPTFDIHGGGKDLLFPHHENERAQSVASNGGEFARYWVHNGFVTVESEKMSKSLGNFLTIRDALEAYHPEVLRLFLLSKHYRSPLDFSNQAVGELQSGLVRFYRTLQRAFKLTGKAEVPEPGGVSAFLPDEPEDSFLHHFIEVMDDDLNTAGAVGLLFDRVRELNRIIDQAGDAPGERDLETIRTHTRVFLQTARILGLLREDPDAFLDALAEAGADVDQEAVEALIAQRAEARKQKDWAGADAIRDQLNAMGIILEDGPGRTTWRVEPK
jgi:cysteinyl-tRNA synthetase